MEKYTYTDRAGRPRADFAVRVAGDECEPYIGRGGRAFFERGAEIRDGDAGLFLSGGRAVIRQYCEDWAGNAYLLAINRRRSALDEFIPRSESRAVCCFGRLILSRDIPLPER